MNKSMVDYFHFIVNQANAADMDIGVSTNVIATLLDAYEKVSTERDALRTACEGARVLIRTIDAANPGGFSIGAVLLTLDQVL